MNRRLKESINQAKSGYGASRKSNKDNQHGNHYPRMAEPALIHPLNNSTIKLRNNGMIDVFVDTDNGIRIDPTTKTVNIIANTYKDHVDQIKRNVKKHVDQKVGGHWRLNTKGNVQVIASGKVEVRSKGNVQIESAKDLTLSAKGKLTMKASNLNVNVSDTFASKAGLYDFRS